MAHSELSPSKRHRWSVCPGSIKESRKYPEEPSGPAAIDGTHTHSLLSLCLSSPDPIAELNHLIGATLTDDDGAFKVGADRAARVRVALDYLLTMPSGCEIRSEQAVDLYNLCIRNDLGGTADIVVISENMIEVIDYKDGMTPVEVVGNKQLEQYAIGVVSEVLSDDCLNIDMCPTTTIRLTIIQPKMALRGLPVITSHDLTLSEVMKVTDDIIDEAAATDDPYAPLVPGDHCKYCPAAKSCLVRSTSNIGKMDLMFHTTSNDLTQQAAGQDANTMSDQQIKQLVEVAPLIRQTLVDAEAEALRRMKSGVDIEGLKLVHGRGARSWSLPDDEIADKLRKMGIPKEVVYETSVLSIAKVEKITWEKRNGEKKQLTPRQLEMLKKEYVKKSEGKLTVAPESDDRPAVIMNAASLFSAVVEAPVTEIPSWML